MLLLQTPGMWCAWVAPFCSASCPIIESFPGKVNLLHLWVLALPHLNKILLERLAKKYDEWSGCVAIWFQKLTTLPKLKISLQSVIKLIKRQSFIHQQMHILRSSVATYVWLKKIQKSNQCYQNPSNHPLKIDIYTSNQLSSILTALLLSIWMLTVNARKLTFRHTTVCVIQK